MLIAYVVNLNVKLRVEGGVVTDQPNMELLFIPDSVI